MSDDFEGDALPTTEAEWLAISPIAPLEPDEIDLYHASHTSLPRCPFCGQFPLVAGEKNHKTGIIAYRVLCDIVHCGASVFYNARTREEARAGAIERWTKRDSGRFLPKKAD